MTIVEPLSALFIISWLWINSPSASCSFLVYHFCFITPRACARGKAICLSVVVGTKIAISRLLVICACYKHNLLIDIGEILAYMRFKLLKKAY